MSSVRQSVVCLAAVAVVFTAQSQAVQPDSAKRATFTTNMLPPIPVVQSPVSFFRQLLLMSPAERITSLSGRTPEARVKILAKVREYMAMDPDERELRLRATELRWYIMPLMRQAPADRDAQLTQVPPELRGLVKSRLAQWDALPPSLQQEFLTNNSALHYFAQASSSSVSVDPRQEQIAEQFNQILDLKPEEKQQLLGTLSEAERGVMEKTLKTFGQLPAQQRFQCIRNYTKFAGMTGAERAEFLKNAESWSKMSPQERQAWRDLVANVPLWPPTPLAARPPLPPQIPMKKARTNMATN